MPERAPDVPFEVTLMFAAILVAMIITLALEEKIHAKKSLITGVYAVITLVVGAIYGILPLGGVDNGFGEHIDLPVYIPSVDWGVIAIIFGSSLFVDVVARSGLFTWIAIKLTKASSGDPLKLLIYYGVMTVAFSAMLNNVTAMIIVGSLSAVSLGKLGRKDQLLGFLLIEGLLTNVGGLLTLISSVPNIIVGQAAGISFMRFFVVASPFVLVATVVTILMGARLFEIRRLKTDDERAAAKAMVSSFDENDGVESNAFFYFAAAMTVLFIMAIATTSVLPYLDGLGMGFVAIAFGIIMLIRYRDSVDSFYKALDWDLLFFFIFLFEVINVMEHAEVLGLIGEGLGGLVGLGPNLGQVAILVSSAGFSAVTDNIPLAAMLAKILSGLDTPSDSGLWWAVIFGANLGGNLTPIGSASTVVAVTLMHKYDVRLSFIGFVRKAFPYAVIQVALAIVYVLFAVPWLK